MRVACEEAVIIMIGNFSSKLLPAILSWLGIVAMPGKSVIITHTFSSISPKIIYSFSLLPLPKKVEFCVCMAGSILSHVPKWYVSSHTKLPMLLLLARVAFLCNKNFLLCRGPWGSKQNITELAFLLYVYNSTVGNKKIS